MLRYTRCNIVILMAATAWLMLSFSSCIVCGFDSHTVLFKCNQRKSPPRGGIYEFTNQIRTRYRNWRTTSATQLQPSESLRYIGYTSPWLDVHSCVLMQEATTFNIFYDGTSFQHLATVLISVFTLCYGPGLLFRGPFCITIPISIYGSTEQYSLHFMADTIIPTETQLLIAAISAPICDLLKNCSYFCFWFLWIKHENTSTECDLLGLILSQV